MGKKAQKAFIIVKNKNPKKGVYAKKPTRKMKICVDLKCHCFRKSTSIYSNKRHKTFRKLFMNNIQGVCTTVHLTP